MLGALSELDQPDGPARVDALLHASAFGSLPGGETTETIIQPATGPTPPLPADPGKPEPGIFKNRVQHKVDFEIVKKRVLRDVTAETSAFNIAERASESKVRLGRL